MKKRLIVIVCLLMLNFAYLQFELMECERLVELHGEKYFCLPISVITIPLVIVAAIGWLILAWLKKRRA